jgi:hypothetical protein
VHPARIAALAVYVLEVKMAGPDMLANVLNLDTVSDSEVGRTTCARAGTDTAGPSTEDATGTVWCRVAVNVGEMCAEDGLVDVNVMAAVVDHAAHDGRRRDLRNWLRIG